MNSNLNVNNNPNYSEQVIPGYGPLRFIAFCINKIYRNMLTPLYFTIFWYFTYVCINIYTYLHTYSTILFQVLLYSYFCCKFLLGLAFYFNFPAEAAVDLSILNQKSLDLIYTMLVKSQEIYTTISHFLVPDGDPSNEGFIQPSDSNILNVSGPHTQENVNTIQPSTLNTIDDNIKDTCTKLNVVTD